MSRSIKLGGDENIYAILNCGIADVAAAFSKNISV